MTALIPVNLTENLSPEELTELLSYAEADQTPPEKLIVLALKAYLPTRRPTAQAEKVPA